MSSITMDKLALAAIIIALITLPISLYSITQINKTTSDIQQQLNTMNQQLGNLDQLAQQVNTLADEINTINQQLENSPTADDLYQLADEISSIKASLTVLNQTLATSNETTRQQIESLLEQIQILQEKLQSLQSQVESLLYPTTVVDATGDEVIIPAKPERIVALAPSIVEILYYLNATDRLVGATSYTDWPPEVAQALQNGTITDVGGFFTPNIETILSLQPDLVIGLDNVPSHSQIKEILSARGIPMILLPQSTIYDVKTSILLTGKAIGDIAKATQVAADFESKILTLKLAAENVEPIKVGIIVWINPIFIAGNGTFQAAGLEQIGAVNAFANYTGWASISPEDLLSASPDVIILTGISVDSFLSYLNETLGPDYTSIPAIQEGRVYCIQYPLTNLLNRPSPRLADGLLLLQYIVYPELYNATSADIPSCITEFPAISFPTP